jgi:hypothetical protein
MSRARRRQGLQAGEEFFLILLLNVFFPQAEKSAPHNVLVMPFIPQQAILAHKNTRKEVHRSSWINTHSFQKEIKLRDLYSRRHFIRFYEHRLPTIG